MVVVLAHAVANGPRCGVQFVGVTIRALRVSYDPRYHGPA